jgi:hypothetical protein
MGMTVNRAAIYKAAQELSNWGRWGDDDQIGLGDPGGEVGRRLVDDPALPRFGQRRGGAADADHVADESAGLEGQANRPADQSHSHDRDARPRRG